MLQPEANERPAKQRNAKRCNPNQQTLANPGQRDHFAAGYFIEDDANEDPATMQADR